jgi:ABC-type Mn2+/Zn2+ transport system permease subunit
MDALVEILNPGFLLRDALYGSLLVGAVCPLVGVYFVLRRMIFLGVALPQLSAAGIASSFLVYRTVIGQHEHPEVGERVLAMIGSSVFTLVGLLALAAFERRGRDTIEARIGATYAVSGALTILFLAADPLGEAQMVNLLKGDLLATTGTGLAVLVGVYASVVAILFAFRKEFLLVSFDRDLALVFGKNATGWDVLLYLVSGVAISFAVMTAGPLVAFGFLVIPPLAARLVTRHMVAFSLLASAIGAAGAFGGFYCAYRFDLPLGPTQVAVVGIVLVSLACLSFLRQQVARRAPADANRLGTSHRERAVTNESGRN